MSETFTKTMARNIFFGGSLFFILVFIGLAFHTTKALPERDNRQNLTDTVIHGKLLWEENNCLGCHSLMGEGAYFAPELANVYDRFGKSKLAIKAFIKSRPEGGIPGRRSMPQFHFSEEELEALAEFLKYTSEINDADWPPNIQG